MGGWAGSVPGPQRISDEAMDDYVAPFTPAVIAASCADYRAGATFDSDLDEADRAAGRTITCPVHALWGDRRARRPTRRSSRRGGAGSAADQPVTGRPCPAATSSPRSCPSACTPSSLAFLGYPVRVSRASECFVQGAAPTHSDAAPLGWLVHEVGDAGDAFAEVVVTESEREPGVPRCAERFSRHERHLRLRQHDLRQLEGGDAAARARG